MLAVKFQVSQLKTDSDLLINLHNVLYKRQGQVGASHSRVAALPTHPAQKAKAVAQRGYPDMHAQLVKRALWSLALLLQAKLRKKNIYEFSGVVYEVRVCVSVRHAPRHMTALGRPPVLLPSVGLCGTCVCVCVCVQDEAAEKPKLRERLLKLSQQMLNEMLTSFDMERGTDKKV